MISCSFAGTCGFNCRAETGARFRMASRSAAAVYPLNAWRPVAISYRTKPKEKRSVRASTFSGGRLARLTGNASLNAWGRDARAPSQLRQPEIQNLRLPPRGDEDVRIEDIPSDCFVPVPFRLNSAYILKLPREQR